MAIIYTDSKHYQNIGAAIRRKNGTDTKYKPEEMAPAIDALPVGGDIEDYDGPYEATARTDKKVVLATKQKRMIDDVTVNTIPIAATENGSGGYTATIGE